MSDRLVVRLPNWLGDTVMAVPALRALRDAFPTHRLLGAGPWARILAGQGLVDVLVTYPRGWAGRLRAADTVRDFAPGLAVLLPNSLEAALAARYWGAGRRVGFATEGRTWLLTDPLPVPCPRLHQVDEYVRLAEHLGGVVSTREPALAAPPTDSELRAEARWRLQSAGVERGDRGPVVGIHLGAAYGSSKLWPVARVADLVRILAREGARPVLLGPADSGEAARQVGAAVSVASVVGQDTPDVLPALLGELDLLVAGDTGVTHLASALGTPVIALFGPTDPQLTAPRGPAVIVNHPVPCAPCFYRVCPIDHPCLRDVTAETVADHIRSALA